MVFFFVLFYGEHGGMASDFLGRIQPRLDQDMLVFHGLKDSNG